MRSANDSKNRKIRVLLSKIGLDGHDRGVKVLAQLLREASMEVVYLGMYQTAENIIRAAIQEDVDVIGLSILSGEHLKLAPKVIDHLKKENLYGEYLLIVGGVIPREDIPVLKSHGVHEVFTAGTLVEEIAPYIEKWVTENKRGGVK